MQRLATCVEVKKLAEFKLFSEISFHSSHSFVPYCTFYLTTECKMLNAFEERLTEHVLCYPLFYNLSCLEPLCNCRLFTPLCVWLPGTGRNTLGFRRVQMTPPANYAFWSIVTHYMWVRGIIQRPGHTCIQSCKTKAACQAGKAHVELIPHMLASV